MSGKQIIFQRLMNQQLAGSSFSTAHDLVSHMGCIQAQDYAAAKWAIGIRIKTLTNALIEQEFNEGKILRTHVLRPTWHFVSPNDIGWMLQLTAPKVKMLTAGYHHRQGINSATLKQSQKIFTTALTGGRQLTREDFLPMFKAQNIKTNDNHLSFLLLEAELDGLVCSGARKGKSFTYALLEERVPKPMSLDKDEALTRLTKIYFTSHGPATVHDFAWWSGLNISEAKIGIEINKRELIQTAINGLVYWSASGIQLESNAENSVHLLPAYDEYAVAYKDRSLTLDPQYNALAGSGIFKPTLIINGRVAGVWKRTEKKDKVCTNIMPFTPLSKISTQKIMAEAKHYGKFLGKTAIVNEPG